MTRDEIFLQNIRARRFAFRIELKHGRRSKLTASKKRLCTGIKANTTNFNTELCRQQRGE